MDYGECRVREWRHEDVDCLVGRRVYGQLVDLSKNIQKYAMADIHHVGNDVALLKGSGTSIPPNEAT